MKKLWNSLLILVRDLNNPSQVAIGIAVGVWIGVSPFWGLHTILALAVSFLARLNAPAVLLGTMISNPWCAPLVILLSAQLGCHILRLPHDLVSFGEIRLLLSDLSWEGVYRQILVPYVAGSLVLATFLAFVAYWISLVVARRFSRNNSRAQ